MFVPSTSGGRLLNMLEEVETKLRESGDATWSVKLVEMSGNQLSNMFSTRMPVREGCPLGLLCKVCENDTIKCSTRGIVYIAECADCKHKKKSGGDGMSSWYIGESSRPLRMRAREHWVNLENLNIDTFMLTHWMKTHGLQILPPKYTFKIIGVYKDCLSRQVAKAIHIE